MKTIEPPKTQIGRILCRDDEQSLLKAIAEDEVFGFLVCDVSTPENLTCDSDILKSNVNLKVQ